MKILSALFLIALSFKGMAQGVEEDSISPWTLGLAVGYYLSGDATATYYNASDAGINLGKDQSRLVNLLTNVNTEPRIRESLGGYDFELAEYAQDIRYNNTASFDLQLSYNFKNGWMFSTYFRTVKLTAAGIFTLRVNRVNQGSSPVPYLERATISGKETRSHIDFGIGKKIEMRQNFFTLLEAGLDLNFVEVKENKVEIAGTVYPLPIFTDPINPQSNQATTVGAGFFAGVGLGYQLPGQWGFLLKATYIQTKVDVNKLVEETIPVFLPTLGFSRSF